MSGYSGYNKEINKLISEKRDLITALESMVIMVQEVADLPMDGYDEFTTATRLLSDHGVQIK